MDRFLSLIKIWKEQGPRQFINQCNIDRTFGVEIECFHGPTGYLDFTVPYSCFCRCGRSKCKEKSYSSFATRSKLPRGWKIVGDCSVPGTAEEVTSPVLQGRVGLVEVNTVLRKLRRSKYIVDDQCGAHTNIGVDPNDWDLVVDKWNEIDSNALRRQLPGARNSDHFWTSIGASYYKSMKGLNIRSNRVEFRLWEGTLDYTQWLAQICFGCEFIREAIK